MCLLNETNNIAAQKLDYLKNNILVIGPSWLGDMVMAQSLFKHILLINSKTNIDVLAPSWSFKLLERMPEVNGKILLNLSHGEFGLKTRYDLGIKLRKKNYEQAIILPNSWKSAIIPFIAKIPKRTGWIGEARFGLVNDIRRKTISAKASMVASYVELAYSPNYIVPKQSILFPKLTIDEENVKKLSSKFNIKLNDKLPILGLCLDAAFGQAKCWPEEYFIELAAIAVANKFNVWIFGTKVNVLFTEHTQIINFSGKTTILETIDLLSLVDLVVCNDSGLMHIAASLNKKIIAIYGPTSDQWTPPLGIPGKYKIINKNLPCSPCFARSCPLIHHNCMRKITVAEVFEQVKLL